MKMIQGSRAMGTTVILLLGLASAGTAAFAVGSEQAPSSATKSYGGKPAGQQAAPRLPVYKPPMLGAPSVRVGGATRGLDRIYALAPDHVGLTASAHPRLYWFVSAYDPYRAKFVLKNAQNSATILQHVLPMQPREGFGYLDLEDLGIRLSEGTSYQWTVELIRNDGGSSMIASQGYIQRTAPAQPRGMTDMDEIPFLAAESGFWYDAIAAASQLVEFDPQNPRRRKQRAALLQQIGLRLAADYDLRIAEDSAEVSPRD